MYGSQRNNSRLTEGLEGILVKVGHSNPGCKLQPAHTHSDDKHYGSDTQRLHAQAS